MERGSGRPSFPLSSARGQRQQVGEALGERRVLLLPQPGDARRRLGRAPGLCAELCAAFSGGDPGRPPFFTQEGPERKCFRASLTQRATLCSLGLKCRLFNEYFGDILF